MSIAYATQLWKLQINLFLSFKLLSWHISVICYSHHLVHYHKFLVFNLGDRFFVITQDALVNHLALYVPRRYQQPQRSMSALENLLGGPSPMQNQLNNLKLTEWEPMFQTNWVDDDFMIDIRTFDKVICKTSLRDCIIHGWSEKINSYHYYLNPEKDDWADQPQRRSRRTQSPSQVPGVILFQKQNQSAGAHSEHVLIACTSGDIEVIQSVRPLSICSCTLNKAQTMSLWHVIWLKRQQPWEQITILLPCTTLPMTLQQKGILLWEQYVRACHDI